MLERTGITDHHVDHLVLHVGLDVLVVRLSVSGVERAAGLYHLLLDGYVGHRVAGEELAHLLVDYLASLLRAELCKVVHVAQQAGVELVDLRDLRHGACTLRTGRRTEDFGVPRLLVDDVLEGFALRHALSALQEHLVLPPLDGRGQCRLAQLHQQLEGSVATGIGVDLRGTGNTAALHTPGTQLYLRCLLHHRVGCECHYLYPTCLIQLLYAGPV